MAKRIATWLAMNPAPPVIMTFFAWYVSAMAREFTAAASAA